MTIDHSSERKICRGLSVSSNNSSASNQSMSTHLLVPGIQVSRSGSFNDQNEKSSRRVLPIRSGSFRDQAELEREKQYKQQMKSGNRRESPDIASDAYYYLKANAALQQRRRSSLPASSPNLLSCSNEDVKDTRETRDPSLRRVRSFKTTTKGVVNRGDSVRKRGARGSRENTDDKVGNRLSYTPSPNPARHIPFEVTVDNSNDNSGISSYYKVVVLGANGVGKTSITHQFLTSEYVAFDNSADQGENIVTVQLNGEESVLEFIDASENEMDLENIKADAYIIVFSIAHRDTFDTAADLLMELRLDLGIDRTVIMVGNKLDLVRKRKVKLEEALDVSKMYDGRYIEVSAGLNHHIDELLVGTLGFIRYKLNPSLPVPVLPLDNKKDGTKLSMKGPINFFSRLFRRVSSKKKRGRRRLHTVT